MEPRKKNFRPLDGSFFCIRRSRREMKQFSVPSGMRDLILGECETKKDLQLKIENILSKWGYEEVITPTIEYYSTYENGFIDIKEEDMYKFFDANGKILMLRADMTIPIARVAATKFKDETKPLRFRYCANVFKVHESLSGLKDEITDCGVELIGMEEKCAELEILVTAMEVLQVVEDKKVILEIGDVNFFRKACQSLQLSEEETMKLSKLLDSKSLIALEDYLKQLQLNEKDQQFFNYLPWLSGDASILEEAKKYAFNDDLVAIIDRLQLLDAQLKELGYETIEYDLGKASNLNYYTGLIFEAYVEGVGTRILSGGSYNTLIERFGEKMSATGFSIKLDSLLEVVPLKKKKKGYILEYPSHQAVEAMKIAAKLRKEKKVEMYVNDDIDEIRYKEDSLCCQSH